MSEGRYLLRKRLALIVLLAVGWLQPWQEQGALAQKLPPTVAAVIDYQRILRDAAAARSIRDQIEARRKAYQEEISKEEQRLHEADKAFAEQRSVLSPEAFAEKRRDFEQEVAKVQRMVQERRRELDRLSVTALNEVKQALVEIVTSIAKERGFNLVLPSSEVLFFARALDLTEEVLGKLDARLPKVQLSEVAD
ncbi:MAG TPA: OmpH family outer membrane protein [Geminicoccaceae bacterium]|nr:OmpH family outer membrane protein [Geminicoccaceae bacterium]